MATTLAIGDVLEVKFNCWQPNQLGINALHYIVTGPVTGTPTLEAISDQLSSNAANLYAQLISQDSFYCGLQSRRIAGGAPTGVYTSILGNAAGQAPGEDLPQVVSGIITKRTGLPGRRNRGRVYLPFPTETDNAAAGVPSVAYRAKLSQWATLLLEPMTITTFGGSSLVLTPGVHHRVGNTTTIVTGWTAQPKWASQHRRGGYGKLNPRPF